MSGGPFRKMTAPLLVLVNIKVSGRTTKSEVCKKKKRKRISCVIAADEKARFAAPKVLKRR